MKFIRNVLLLVAVLVLSYFTAPYFGTWYDSLYIQHPTFIFSKNDAVMFAGFLFAYVFFLPLLMGLFGAGNKNKWIFWLLAPVIAFYLYDSIKLSYLPIGLAFISFALAKIINLIVSKFKHSHNELLPYK